MQIVLKPTPVVLLTFMLTSMAVPKLSAQTPSQSIVAASGAGSDVRWRPAVLVGIGVATTGGESGASTTPLVAAVRTVLTPRVMAEVEWTSRERYTSSFDSGPSRIATLNGQIGEYGRATSHREETAHSHVGVNILGRTTIGRVSPFTGVGVTAFRRTYRVARTRTGCTGPWVSACLSPFENAEDSWESSGIAPQWLGGLDVDITSWLQVYGNGRWSTNFGQSEASVLGGVRVAVLPERRAKARRAESAPSAAPASLDSVRTGQKVWVTTADGMERVGTLQAVSASSITMIVESNEVTVPMPAIRYVEKPDPVVNGAIWGVVVGTVVGAAYGAYTDARALPVSMLIGTGAGALLDSLHGGRQLMYSASGPAISVAPALAPGHAAVGVRLAWR